METMAVEEEAMNVMDADVVVQDVVQPEVQEVQQVQEVEKTINGSIEKIEEVVMEEMPSTQIPTTPEMVEPMIEAASEEVIMPVATPSVEAPAVAVETSEPVQQIVEQAPARVSPYVPTY